MATYAAYRHIELDKVGYSKKRVCNTHSEIFQVLTTPTKSEPKKLSALSVTPPRSSSRRNSATDSFNRLFGDSAKISTPRRQSLTKHDVTNRNPVTGNGVQSWDARPARASTPKIHAERNPVTGESYSIVSPPSTPTAATTPTKILTNGGGFPTIPNGNTELPSGPITNGQA